MAVVALFTASALFSTIGQSVAAAAGAGVAACDPSFVPADAANIQTRMNDCPAGTTYTFATGVYRLNVQIFEKDGDSFVGAGSGPTGSRFLGSKVITGWTHPNSLWVHSGDVVNDGTMPDKCRGGGTACDHLDWLLRDSEWLGRVVAPCTGLAADQFCIDYGNNKIFLGADPGTAVFDYATLTKFLSGYRGERNVKVRDLSYSEFASLEGTISAGPGWRITNVHGHHNHSCGISALGHGTAANPAVIKGSTFDHNGYHGYCDPSESVRIIGNDFSYNNDLGFEFGTGIVLHGSTGLVKGNDIHDNHGTGLKLTFRTSGLESHDMQIINNTVTNNKDLGIQLEEACGNLVQGNTVSGNTNFGIHLFDANTNTVTNNQVTVPASATGGGIVIVAQHRSGTSNCGAKDDASDNTVSGNDVTMGTVADTGRYGNINGTVKGGGILTNEQFTGNHYHLRGGDCTVLNWRWFDGSLTQNIDFADWQQIYGQDVSGNCGS